MQSAVLDRLTGPLCDAVTGRQDGTDMLPALERANLFLIALDTDASGTGTTTCSPTCCGRGCSATTQPGPAAAPARQPVVRDHDLTEDAVTHASPRGTSTRRPARGIGGADNPAHREKRAVAGWRRVRTPCAGARCSVSSTGRC